MRNLIDKLRPGRTFLMLCFLLVFSCSKDKEEGNGDTTKYTLTITTPTDGTLVSKPEGINCGSKTDACEAKFDKDSEVMVMATADTGYVPTAWQGACDKTDADQPCKLTMNANQTAGKLFLVKLTLTIDPKPKNGTLVSDPVGINCGSKDNACEAKFDKDTEVTLTAKANTGYASGDWGDACEKASADETCKLTMDADKGVGKAFPVKLTLTITKPINGTLVSDPAGINCGSKGNACKAEFSKGMEVTLIAKADKGSVDTDLGYAPAAWQGNCDKTEADQACKLSMDANKAAGLLFTDADVDDDNDGLIEIHNLDMFNHIQYSLAGTSYKTGADAADDQDGAPTATTANCKTATDGVYLCGYELVGDLDFAEGASYAAGSVNTDWRPLDVDDSPVIDDPPDMATNAGFVGATDFAGIFEGNGYKITHLYSRGGGNRGLFRSTTSTASIRNLGVVDANLYGGITNDGRVGGLAGDNAGSIVSCYAKGGTVNGGNGGQDYTGGLVGLNIGSILASFSTSTVNGSGNAGFNRVGGLVGYSKSSSTITASFATGNVSGGSGNGDLVGGLAGQLSDGCIILASYATGDADGGAGGDNVGGLVGYMSAGINTILASYATGTANGNVSDNVGGLVGHMSVGTNTITHSYSFGSGTKEGSGNDGTAHPTGLTGSGAAKANTLTDPAGMDDTDADDVWDDAGEKTKGAWDFGTNSQRPALKYADYDGTGGTDYCAMFPTKIPGTDDALQCGVSLLPEQRP